MNTFGGTRTAMTTGAHSPSPTTSDHATNDHPSNDAPDAGEETKRVTLDRIPLEHVEVPTISEEEMPKVRQL